MAINNISDYSKVAETIASLSKEYDQMKNTKDELTTLFEGSFALMGGDTDPNDKTNTAKVIYDEMEELKNLITKYQKDIEAWNRVILQNENAIGTNKDELDNLILKYGQENTQKQSQAIADYQEINADVLDQFAKGIIPREQVADEIMSRVQTKGILKIVEFPEGKVNELKGNITTAANIITNLIVQQHALNEKVSTAQGALTLLNEMYQMQIIAKGTRIKDTKGTDGVPVYTKEQEAMIDQWYAQYHSSATPNVDAYSIGNKQLQNMGEALGIKTGNSGPDAGALGGTSDYTKSVAKLDQPDRSSLYQNSILQDMYNAGFTYREAMYACQYIFGTGTNLFSYNTKNNKITIAWGHFTNRDDWSKGNNKSDARQVTDSFVNQAKSLWGKAPEQVEPGAGGGDDPGAGGGDDPGAGGGYGGDDRTDPIGWSVGNVTYEFVIDRDNDSKFNDKSEFLGAGVVDGKTGIDQLRVLDEDKDGKVTAAEMAAANVYVLKHNQDNSGFGILTASDAGIQEIDLSTINEIENSHADVNGNTVKNIFDIRLTSGTVTGYQSLDDNEYLQAVYGARFGEDLTAKLNKSDETVAAGFKQLSGFVLLDEAGKSNAITNANNIIKAANAKKAAAVEAAQAEERRITAEELEIQRSTVEKVNATEEESNSGAQDKPTTDKTRQDLIDRIATFEKLKEDMYNQGNKSKEDEAEVQIRLLTAQLLALPA